MGTAGGYADRGGLRTAAAARHQGQGQTFRAAPGTDPGTRGFLAFTEFGRALMQLPLHHREVLVLHYLADLPIEQIISAWTGQGLRVLIPAAANPAEYGGPLWTDRFGRHLLAACGNDAEARIDDGHLSRLPSRWHLPSYPVPGGPQIAW